MEVLDLQRKVRQVVITLHDRRLTGKYVNINKC